MSSDTPTPLIPPPCPPGTDHCPCYPNNTCARIDGVSLVCEQGICLPPNDSNPSSESALGQACNQDDECGSYRDLPLTCQSGRCELAGCPTATAGCPCGDGERCEEGTRCTELGFCVDPSCEPGQNQCTCTADNLCAEGGRCVAGLCRASTQIELSITDPSLRGCQARLELPPEASVEVRFDPALRGQHIRRGGVIALSFVNRTDTSTAGSNILISLTHDDAEVHLMRVSCVDRLGRTLSGHGLSLSRVSP